jgi:hypothetical protein
MQTFRIPIFLIAVAVFAGCSISDVSVEPSYQKDNPIAVDQHHAAHEVIERLFRLPALPGN